MRDKPGKWMPFKFPGELFQDKVAGHLLDFLGNESNSRIVLGRQWEGFPCGNGDELIGVVLDLEKAHSRANFIQCCLRKLRAWDVLEPFDHARVGVAALDI